MKKHPHVSIKDMFSAASAMASITKSLMFGSDKNVTANPDGIDWEAEREDILER